jgi:Fic family protein
MTHIDQLQSILRATGWSQEQIARELKTSFPTLNSWVNGRSVPRKSAIEKINFLYIQIIGTDAVEGHELAAAKLDAQRLKITPKALVANKEALDRLILHLTYHTNTIEGSTMTLADVEGVLFDHKVLSNRTAIEQAEARNHQAALVWLLDTMVAKGQDFLITEQLILDLHVRLMNGIISSAGQYRRHAVRIMGSHVPLSNWQKIPEQIQVFIHGQQSLSKDLILRFAESHAEFEKIHPFSDGNGRTGRLLLLAQALQAGVVPPLVVRERKQAYYKYLELAQTKENYRTLELFMAQSIRFCGEVLNLK